MAAFTSCMEVPSHEASVIHTTMPGDLLVLCEGNFQYGNASLSLYAPDNGVTDNNVFYKVNGYKLGDVAQSVTMHADKAWVVVNNSHVVFALHQRSMQECGRITGLTSPRYMHFVNEAKAYITQLWDNRIFVVDPRTYSITGHITVPGMEAGNGSTEQMVQLGQYVYCTCWSYQNRIIKIDTRTDSVVASVEVGIQPKGLVTDAYGRLWCLTDGGYEGSPYGWEAPRLVCLDATTLDVLSTRRFGSGESPRGLIASGDGYTLYWIDGGVWSMSADGGEPRRVIAEKGTRFYALTVDPKRGDIYVADALDYQQSGIVYRFTVQGLPVGQFTVGITPGAFGWLQ